MENKNFVPLQPGEKWLAVSVLGGKAISCFPNKKKNKDNPKLPDFVGSGIAIWINEKKAMVSQEKSL